MAYSTFLNDFKLENYQLQSTLTDITADANCSILQLNISSTLLNLCIANYSVRATGVVSNLTDISIQYLNYTETAKLGDTLQLVCGHVTNYNGSNYVKGYMNNNRFFGKVQMGAKTVCVEPAKYFSQLKGQITDENEAVVYEQVSEIGPFREEFIQALSFNPTDVFNLDMNANYGRFIEVKK